ncbi:MAG: S8 family serine peptidase [Bacteroidota bacterium]
MEKAFHVFRISVLCLWASASLVAQHVNHTWIAAYHMGAVPQVDSLKRSGIAIQAECIFPSLNLWSISTTSQQKSQQLHKFLSQDPRLRYIHANTMAEWRISPNDPDFVSQWGMRQIGMEEVWDITQGGQTTTGEDIVIAIFDDGFQVDHQDYRENVWTNTSEIPNNGVDDDGNGYVDDVFGWNATAENDQHNALNHGTSVAGIIGARGQNGLQIAGMNWNTKMMFVSGGTQAGVDLRDVVKAYNYVFAQRRMYNQSDGENGTFVVALNYSGGAEGRFPEDFPSWCEVIEELGSVGILTIGSAPNNPTNIDEEGDLPGTCPSEHLIIVTNTDRFDNIIQSSGFGPIGVDIGAPGDGIYTLAVENGVDPSFFGTSASAPFVAGLIPLLYQLVCEESYADIAADPSAFALQIKSAIMNTTTRSLTLDGITTTGGRVDALAAINLIDESIGDCCSIEIEDIVITDETCIDANDARVEISATGQDLSGPIQYELRTTSPEINELGRFDRLDPGQYPLQVSDPNNISCRVDTIVALEEGIIDCPFGDFEITGLSYIGQNLQIEYNLDEQKLIQVQLHDNMGRLLYDQIVNPPLSGSRSLQVPTGWLADGIYHASILATGFRDVASFVVVN